MSYKSQVCPWSLLPNDYYLIKPCLEYTFIMMGLCPKSPPRLFHPLMTLVVHRAEGKAWCELYFHASSLLRVQMGGYPETKGLGNLSPVIM